MKMYQAETTISASPQTIWDILTDGGDYPAWDPGMDRVEGRIAAGETVKFFIKTNPNQAFAVKVSTFEPGKKMVFSGGMPLGLFKSERTHTLTDNNDGTTTFHTHEIFSGLLLPVFGKSIPDLTPVFETFTAGLKGAAEKAG